MSYDVNGYVNDFFRGVRDAPKADIDRKRAVLQYLKATSDQDEKPAFGDWYGESPFGKRAQADRDALAERTRSGLPAARAEAMQKRLENVVQAIREEYGEDVDLSSEEARGYAENLARELDPTLEADIAGIQGDTLGAMADTAHALDRSVGSTLNRAGARPQIVGEVRNAILAGVAHGRSEDNIRADSLAAIGLGDMDALVSGLKAGEVSNDDWGRVIGRFREHDERRERERLAPLAEKSSDELLQEVTRLAGQHAAETPAPTQAATPTREPEPQDSEDDSGSAEATAAKVRALLNNAP